MTRSVHTLPLRTDVLLSQTLFEELEDGITDEFLHQYLGTNSLTNVDSLEIKVDAVCGSQRVECIGELLPSLRQLRLNQSYICSVRDLGTSLRNLRVLWMSRTLLQDLAGIAAMPCLEELYVSFNNVQDLAPLSTHEALRLIDLEGNLVDDFEEVESLANIATLREVNLSLNPFWKCDGVTRESVLEFIPQLEVLDDVPRKSVADFGNMQMMGCDSYWIGDSCDSHWIGDEEEDDDESSESLPEFLEHPPARTFAAAVEPESQALIKLRQRGGCVAMKQREAWAAADSSHACRSPVVVRKPVTALDGPQRPRRRGTSSQPTAVAHGAASADVVVAATAASSGAVAELHASLARLRSEAPTPRSSDSEPTEQELLVEALKRAERPASSLWELQSLSTASCRGASHGFCHGNRSSCNMRQMSVGSSASTAYRPSTPSGRSDTSSCASTALPVETETASDLTSGHEGGALVGNPLSVARRRKQMDQACGEEALDIRNLLRRHASVAREDSPCSSQTRGILSGTRANFAVGEQAEGFMKALDKAEMFRPSTPDVRISSARVLTRGRLLTPVVMRHDSHNGMLRTEMFVGELS